MMNFYTMLQIRASKGRPVKVGVIGAGKFSAMFLSHFSNHSLTPDEEFVKTQLLGDFDIIWEVQRDTS
jgi:hypothetical protein